MAVPSKSRSAAHATAVHVLGVRHHGPGSARSLRQALASIEPDLVLIEGPPDANALIPLAAHAEMQPPVAILVYRIEKPSDSVFYPFADFSPEWQAIRFALERGVPVRFMDWPIAQRLPASETQGEKTEPSDDETEPPSENGDGEPATPRIRVDPLQVLAEAAGYDDGERWWEHIVEHRRDGADLFAAIREAMVEVRDHIAPAADVNEMRREAHMRQTIRAGLAEGKTKIAVICGAWHAPALAADRWPAVKEDTAILKGLPKVKVSATWVPWTHGRLAYRSGYGAGVHSPGWYHHLWSVPDRVVERWMTRVARLLREEGLDASSASVIESVRLAEALAALRRRPLPGLLELNEATRTVFCFGNDLPLKLIERKLIVGELLGTVPAETPTVPLQQDVNALQKRLRLPPDPAQTTKVLDLREANDLERSRLLHRLDLLGVPWGRIVQVSGKGTFKEGWLLQWQPDFAVAIVEASLWGATVLDAATAKARDLAEKATELPALTQLLDRAILADLPAAVESIMTRLENQAALSSDVTQMMDALPPLANLLRYGNVRKTDAEMVAHAADGLIARIAIGLPLACGSLDDPAADAMFNSIVNTDSAIKLIQDPDHTQAWHATLGKLAESDRIHQLVAGRACRTLFDAQALDAPEVARRMNLAVSTAAEPPRAAAWLEGFLKGSGELLYYDDALFAIFNDWLNNLHAETFLQLVPLLRRTFATFEPPLRRNLGEKAKRGRTVVRHGPATASDDFDETRAATILPLLGQLLGLAAPTETTSDAQNQEPGKP
jgi:hypothetical protein